jgi:uncharacterized membrane protein YebE (DUF533 family)
MSKKRILPDAPLVTIRPPKKAGLLRKTARLGATVVAARVAAGTGKKGVFGILAGAGAKRLIMRYPAGALFVTGAYLAGKVYESKREAQRKKTQRLLTDQSGATDAADSVVPIESARKPDAA